MVRDFQSIQVENEELIITNDNSGSIGNKPYDELNVPYDVVGYYCARTALMENMSVGGEPVSVNLLNFCGDDAWKELVSGINKAKKELEINPVISGSSESNFSSVQSAFGVTVIGVRKRYKVHANDMFAVVGIPLVGEEVVSDEEKMIQLREFKWLVETDLVDLIIPVGSKGIQYELKEYGDFESTVDLYKSAGPSTCVIISYSFESEGQLIKVFGNKFSRLIKKTNLL